MRAWAILRDETAIVDQLLDIDMFHQAAESEWPEVISATFTPKGQATLGTLCCYISSPDVDTEVAKRLLRTSLRQYKLPCVHPDFVEVFRLATSNYDSFAEFCETATSRIAVYDVSESHSLLLRPFGLVVVAKILSCIESPFDSTVVRCKGFDGILI